jgi:hypothetical protein
MMKAVIIIHGHTGNWALLSSATWFVIILAIYRLLPDLKGASLIPYCAMPFQKTLPTVKCPVQLLSMNRHLPCDSFSYLPGHSQQLYSIAVCEQTA